MKYNGPVKAKRKDWQKYAEECQEVSGYLLIDEHRHLIYKKAKIDTYGTIIITDYVEVDPNTIEVITDGTI